MTPRRDEPTPTPHEDHAPDRDRLGLVILDEPSCWRLLHRHGTGRIAFVDAARPTIRPVSYLVDGRSIVIRSAPGSKLGAASRAQHVAFEVDESDPTLQSASSVVAHGVLRRVTAPAEAERLRRLPLRRWSPGLGDDVVRLEVSDLSGRRIDPPAGPDGLSADGG